MGDLNIIELGYRASLYFIPFLFALCFHEFAHGWVAKLKGDRTAEMMGRLTLNPVVHMDLIGTLILPMTAILFGLPFFGWAKPVPVNPRFLSNPRVDMFWIALAGPLSNVLLAFVGTLFMVFLFRFAPLQAMSGVAGQLLTIFVMINLFLAVFNMIPLHPLDGGKVLARFLPAQWNDWLEMNQSTTSILLLMVFVMGGFKYLAYPVQWTAQTLLHLAAAVAQI